jgi:hypothetical protein
MSKGKRESLASQSYRESQSAEKKNKRATVQVSKPLSEIFAPVGKLSNKTMVSYAAKHPKVLDQILKEVSIGGNLTHLYPELKLGPEQTCSTVTESGSILCMSGIASLRLRLLQVRTAERLILVSQRGDWDTAFQNNTVQLTVTGQCQTCKTRSSVSEFFCRLESVQSFVLNVGKKAEDSTFTVWEYRVQFLMQA